MLKTYGIKSLEEYNGSNTESFRIYVNNIKQNRTLNIDTFLVDITPQGNLIIDGYYPYIEPNQLLVVGTEIVKIKTYKTNQTDRKTELEVERAYNQTPLTDLLIGDGVYSVEEFTMKVTNYQYTSKMDVMNNPFNVTFGSGYVRLLDNIKQWNMLSNSIQKYNYSLYKTKVFIFEGYDDKVILTFRGYLKKVSFSKSLNDKRQITLNIVDQLGSYWNKDLVKKSFKQNKTLREFLSELFKIPKEKIYFKHINESEYPVIENLAMSNYSTYQEIIELLSSNGIRVIFTPRGHLYVFSEVLGGDKLRSDIILDDVRNLTDISISDDNQLIFNYGNIKYTRQFPYYDLDKGINYKYNKNISVTPLVIQDSGNYLVKEFVVRDSHIASKVSLDVYGTPSVCMLKDNITGIEFICNPLEIQGDTVTFMPIEILNDTGLLEFGKGKWLFDLGFNNTRNYTFYYVQGNLPTVFALSKQSPKNKSAITNNLEIPVSPIVLNDDGTEHINLNKSLTLQFGSPKNLKDLEYTGNYLGVDNIIGTWVGGTHLLYEKEWEQSQRGLDVFVNATRLSQSGINSKGLPIYDTFDNSGFKLEITNPNENDTEIVSKFVNTLRPNVYLKDLPKISFEIGSGEIIGDIALKSTQKTTNILLEPNDVLFPVRTLPEATAHEKLKFREMRAGGIEIRCVAVSNWNGETLLHFNNPLFTNIEYAKISVKDLIYIQNYYIKLNPIVQENNNFYHSDSESIKLYDGKKPFNIEKTIFNEQYTRKLLSYVFSAYKGTDVESIKYVIPINTLKRLELELYDLVTISDETVTGIDTNSLFLIVGKSITFDNNRKIEYTLLNVYNKDYKLLDLKFSQIEKFNPLTDPTFNHSGIQQENTNIKQYADRIEFFDERLGKIIGKIIAVDKFRLHTLETSNDPLIDVELRGEHSSNYAESLFKNTLYETYLIVRIGDEYMYVSPFSYVDRGTTKYRLQVIQRKLANTQYEDNLVDRDVIIYLIAEGSSKDYGLKSNSIYIGDGSHGGYMSYDPYYGLTIRANRIEMVSGGTIGGDMVKNKDFNDFKDQIETRFTQVKNEINLQVSKIDMSNYVKKNEVVAQINLSNEGVRIQGSKIQVDGNTTFSSDTQFNGKVTANRYIIVEGNGKRTIIGAGTIEYQEWSP
jgi:hypothetical protein